MWVKLETHPDLTNRLPRELVKGEGYHGILGCYATQIAILTLTLAHFLRFRRNPNPNSNLILDEFRVLPTKKLSPRRAAHDFSRFFLQKY